MTRLLELSLLTAVAIAAGLFSTWLNLKAGSRLLKWLSIVGVYAAFLLAAVTLSVLALEVLL